MWPELAIVQSIVFFFAALLFFSFWLRGRPSGTGRRDQGLLFLGLAVLTWAFSAKVDALNLKVQQGVFSTVNSTFLLLALSHIDYGPSVINRLTDHGYWWKGVLLSGLVVVVADVKFSPYWDTVYSLPTILALGFAFQRSFSRRGFRLLQILSWLAIALVLFTVCLSIPGISFFGWEDHQNQFRLGYRVLLALVFLGVLVSYAYEVAEKPKAKHIKLALLGRNTTRGQVQVREIGSPDVRIRHLSTKLYDILREFVDLRLTDPDATYEWSSKRLYQLTRIRTDLGILQGQLFENVEPGRYRLAIPPENLTQNIPR